jgi:hypothetical protein
MSNRSADPGLLGSPLRSQSPAERGGIAELFDIFQNLSARNQDRLLAEARRLRSQGPGARRRS